MISSKLDLGRYSSQFLDKGWKRVSIPNLYLYYRYCYRFYSIQVIANFEYSHIIITLYQREKLIYTHLHPSKSLTITIETV